ncbi:MAG: DNRLRE domain-containing protein [Candidatus Odinarchaeota archaeon]
MVKRNYSKFIGLSLIFLFLISGVNSVSQISSMTPKPSIFEDDSITTGENLYQNVLYDFSTVYYDGTNYRNVYTGAKFEAYYVMDNSLQFNSSISNVDNYFTEYGNNNNLTITNGTLDSTGTLNTKDGDSTDIDSEGSGIYPATYTFTDDTIGGKPAGWNINLDYSYVYGHVIEEKYDHSEVTQLYDNSASNYIRMRQTSLNDYTNETIEFWMAIDWQTPNSYNNYYFFLRDDGVDLVGLSWEDDSHVWKLTSDGWESICSLSQNQWYHYSIIFDYDKEGWNLWIDGVDYGFSLFSGDTTDGIDYIRFQSEDLATYSYLWLDAIGYSWDTSYNLGDNLHWNHFLGSETFEGYNQTYAGDYYGSESFDYYTEEGVYYGTYDFRDEVGETNTDIEFIDSVDSGTTTVSSLNDYHKYVLDLGVYSTFYHNFDTYRNTGIVEFWYYKSSTNESLSFHLYEDSTACIVLYIHENNHWVWRDKDDVYQTEDEYFEDTWYHIKIQWYSDNTFDWCINGNLMLDGEYMNNNMTSGINRHRFNEGAIDDVYIDAYGENWDTTSHSGLGYTVGWNTNPYDIEPLLELGYDLDLGYGDSVNVVEELLGHKNILQLNRTSNNNNHPSISTNFTQQTFGTIEMWVYVDDNLKAGRIAIESDEIDNKILIGFYFTGYICFYNGTWNPLVPCQINTWYHFKIEFDCATDWHFWINGTSMDGGSGLTYRGSPSYLNDLKIYHYSQEPCNLYVDAIGYSWDSEYETGYNINPYGKQVLEELENDGWTIMLNEPYTSIAISGEFGSHKKFINCSDQSAYTSFDVKYDFSSSTSGVVSFYYYLDNDNLIAFYLKDGLGSAGVRGYFRHSGNNVKFYDDTVLTTIKTPETNDEWHYMEIEFDCSTYTFSIWIDGELCAEDFTFYQDVDVIANLRLVSSDLYTESNYCYLDAINCDWETEAEYSLRYSDYATVNCTFLIDDLDQIFDLEVLVFDLFSYYKTSEMVNISFSVYDFENTQWVLINNSIKTTFDYISNGSYEIPTTSNFVNASGVMKIKFYMENGTTSFSFSIDQLEIDIWTKLHLSISKSFSLLGTWKFRWRIFGSMHVSDFTYFNVIQQEPNIEMISESPYYTKWVYTVINETIYSYYEEFNDTSESWSFVSEFGDDFICRDISDDAYVYEYLPNNNYGSATHIRASNSIYGLDYRTFIQSDAEGKYLLDKINGNVSFYIYVYSMNPNGFTVYYVEDDIDENIITWNNQPSVYSIYSPNLNIGWNELNGYTNNTIYSIRASLNHEFYARSTEYGDPDYQPYMLVNISKYYQDEYLYMQTNETETLKLISPNLNLDVQDGDKITITYNTTSENQINLNLYNNNNSLIEDYVLEEGGYTSSSTKVATFLISNDFTLKNIELEGFFEDTENIIIDSIGIIETGDVYNYYVEPYGQKDIILGSNDYIVDVYENEKLVYSFNITATLNTYQTLIYEWIGSCEVFLTFYDLNNEYLDFNDYITYVNYTYENETILNKRLSGNHLYIDEDTIVYFKVYDSFEVLVKSYQSIAKTFIDITLNIYSLKIKNEAEEYVSYTLKNNISYVEKSGNIFPEEIVEFNIATGNYILNYTNHEDNYPRGFEFELTTHKIITINTTYHQVYFSLFTYDGLGIEHDLVRFYINNKRKDFGFNTIQSETAHLVVLDFFNNTLANETIDASAYSEYNIFVEIYSLIILNQFTYEDIVINITQIGSGIWMTQIIPKQFGLTYRFLPNLDYNITIYFTNATFYTSRIVNLTENSHIESFGVATKTPEYPKNIYFSVYTGTGLSIQQQLLKFYIDGDRADFGFNIIEDMIITLTVKDFFNTTLFNQMINTSGIYEYDILINIYSIKVKNEAEEIADYTLKLGSLTETGKLFPQEIVEYQLASINYTLEYINNEDDSGGTISVNLNEDKLYIINSTYYQVYVALYNFYGIVNREEVKFYINNTRSDFGFNTIKSNIAHLVVMDFFNNTLYNSNVELRGLKEYSIFIRAYTLVVNNLYKNQTITIKITRGNITLERFIEAQGWIEFKLFPNIEYEIISYVNGSTDEEKNVDLDEEYKKVDFGFYEEEVPYNPEPMIFDFTILLAMIIVICCGGWILVFLYISIKKERDIIPEDTRLRHRRKKNKWKSGTFDHRI